MLRLALRQLREAWPAWGFAALLPLPALLMLSQAINFQISCLYLGIASAGLAAEIFRGSGWPETGPRWAAKMIAVWFAVTANVALFVLLGLSVGIRSHLPFPLIAALSAAPALGLVPWLIVRVKNPYLALILTAMIVTGIKLAACVVARFTYGPDYIAQGYVAADWRTAKLMISLFWLLHPTLSLALLLADCRSFSRRGDG